MFDSTFLPEARIDGTTLYKQRFLPADAECYVNGKAATHMSEFDSLTLAFEKWFDKPLSALPRDMQERIVRDFFPIPWDDLSPEQRCQVALQHDYQHDPATEQERQYWWDFFLQKDALKSQIAEWEKAATPTATDLAHKEAKLKELRNDLSRMDQQERQPQRPYTPGQTKFDPSSEGANAQTLIKYVAYPKALKVLADRWGATPEELAAWIFIGPEDGGLTAHTHANELDPPPQFFYAYYSRVENYIAPLMACWFKDEDIANFQPEERYITGKALIERWSKQAGIHPAAFIRAKIAESRLMDMHPTFGGTEATFSEMGSFPPLETGLFAMSHVRAIEEEDFGTVPPVLSEKDQSRMPNALNKNMADSGHNGKPWLIHNSDDLAPDYPWYTPARYFARELIKGDSTLLTKRDILARKVADALKNVGIMKRGGKKPFDPATVKKAFSNVVLG